MSYIWGYGDIPNYLTAIARTNFISNNDIITLSNGNILDAKNLIYILKDRKRVLKERIFEWDMLNETIGIPLVNKRVLEILERECSGKFQSIPAIIKCPNGEEIKEYYVINVTNKAPVASLEDCILNNMEKERNEPIGPWTFFSKKAFKESVVESEDLCRDSIIGSNLIFISERLRKIFRKEKIKGGGFHKSLRDSVVFV